MSDVISSTEQTNSSGQDLSFYNGGRLFGEFHPDVVFEEVIEERVSISENPIEDGSVIADHAIIRPVSVRLDVCFNSMSKQGLTPNETYAAILDLMKQRVPFDIVTTRRMFKNMMFTRIQNTTNKNNQNTLRLTLEFDQVTLVKLQSVAVKTPKAEKAKTTSKGKVKPKEQTDAAASKAKETAAENSNDSALYKILVQGQGSIFGG